MIKVVIHIKKITSLKLREKQKITSLELREQQKITSLELRHYILGTSDITTIRINLIELGGSNSIIHSLNT